jgi:Domain of unknown function (DUF4129)
MSPHHTLQASVAALFGVIPKPNEEQVRHKLDEVFARPEFSGQDDTLLMRLILQLIAGFFRWLGSLYDTAPVLFWMLLIGCLVLLVLLVVHIVWTVRRVWFAADRHSSHDPNAAQRQQMSLQFRAEADQRAAAGEFTEAIRCLFLSLVYRFDESGRVNFQQAYTNREYLALFADRPPVQQQLGVFVDILDDFWYAQRPTDQARLARCLELYQSLTAV